MVVAEVGRVAGARLSLATRNVTGEAIVGGVGCRRGVVPVGAATMLRGCGRLDRPGLLLELGFPEERPTKS